jgi:hypothetical protein
MTSFLVQHFKLRMTLWSFFKMTTLEDEQLPAPLNIGIMGSKWCIYIPFFSNLV